MSAPRTLLLVRPASPEVVALRAHAAWLRRRADVAQTRGRPVVLISPAIAMAIAEQLEDAADRGADGGEA